MNLQPELPRFHGVKVPVLKEASQGPRQHPSYQQRAVLFCMVGPSYQ
uniref:Similar to ATPANK2 (PANTOTHENATE KINASE 2) n=1 Tax=Arundo donax TaxID=35708 RepID=A0A0A9G970_ARUDO